MRFEGTTALSSIKKPIYKKVYMYAHDVLKDCGIKEPPVPTEVVLDYHGLKVIEFLYSDCPSMSFKDDINPEVCSWLNWKTKTIYVHKRASQGRKRTCIFHESGHCHIPSHYGINYFCTEDDLFHTPKKKLEREAFEYAAELLIPRQFLLNDIMNREAGFDTIRYIQKRYDTSFELAAIRYAKFSPINSCLMVADFIKTDNVENVFSDYSYTLVVRYCVPSKIFPTFFEKGNSIKTYSKIYQYCYATMTHGISFNIKRDFSLYDFGSTNRLKYFAQFKPISGTSSVYIFLWLPEHNLSLF